MRDRRVGDHLLHESILVLTFTKIHNEVGKGKDIYNQATKATLDLSVATGRDMSKAAILVGKALQDTLNFRAQVRTVSAGALPRFEMKARRFVRKGGSPRLT